MAICSACDADIDVDEFDVDRGDQISCSECGALLMVTAIAPIVLEPHDEESPGDFGEPSDEETDDDEWD